MTIYLAFALPRRSSELPRIGREASSLLLLHQVGFTTHIRCRMQFCGSGLALKNENRYTSADFSPFAEPMRDQVVLSLWHFPYTAIAGRAMDVIHHPYFCLGLA